MKGSFTITLIQNPYHALTCVMLFLLRLIGDPIRSALSTQFQRHVPICPTSTCPEVLCGVRDAAGLRMVLGSFVHTPEASGKWG